MTSKDLAGLIVTNTRIILPDFGAFLIKESADKEFNPRNVTFSPFLRYNDGILESHLAKAKSISKDEASKMLKAFIEDVKGQLLDSGTYLVEGLGTLQKDSRGSITFVPGDDSSVGSSAGTPKKPMEEEKKREEKIVRKESPNVAVEEGDAVNVLLHLKSKPEVQKDPPPLDKEMKEEPVPKIEDPAPTVEKLRNVKPHAPVPPTSSVRFDKAVTSPTPKPPIPKSKFRGLLLAAVVFSAIALGVAGYFLVKSFLLSQDDSALKESFSSMQVDEPEDEAIPHKQEIVPKDDMDKAFDKLSKPESVAPVVQPNRKSKENLKDEKVKQSISAGATLQQSAHGRFHVIAGSFSRKDNAEKFSSSIKKEGYGSTIIARASGMYAVTLGSFTSRAEAVSFQKSIGNKYSDTWVLMH